MGRSRLIAKQPYSRRPRPACGKTSISLETVENAWSSGGGIATTYESDIPQYRILGVITSFWSAVAAARSGYALRSLHGLLELILE